MRKKVSFLLLLLSMLLWIAPCAIAQDTTARLSGRVTDPAGSVIPNAAIVLTSTSTKADVAHLTTNERGEYIALQLPPGTYSMTVKVSGFQTMTTEIQLSVAARVELPIELQVGSTEATVVVNAQVQQLNRSDATVSALVSPQDITSLPLPNREINNLIALTPGVVHGGSSTGVNTSQLSINGSRTLNNEVLLDGTSVIEGVTGQISRLPSPDMLGEFRIISANAPAEYGRTSGGVISMLTRSGTDAFHVGAYELFRNAVMNANTFQNKLQTPIKKRPTNNYNQFGIIAGGPVWIPKVYDGRKKTFFYVNYDQTLWRLPATQQQSVPDDKFRAGDFSASHVIIYDPLTNAPFPGNIIPSNRIDPAAKQIMSLLPLPNTIGIFDAVSNRYTNNYYFQNSVSNIQPRYSGRIDHAIGEKLRLYGSVNRWATFNEQALAYNNPLLATLNTCDCHQGWQISTGGTETLNTTTVIDVRVGWNRWVELRNPASVGVNPAVAYGIQRNPIQEPPVINISAYSQIGPSASAWSHTYSNSFTPYGSVTKVIGPHTIKVGGLLRKNQVNVFNPGTPFNGTYSFNGGITDASGTGGKATNSLADFLLGAVKTSQYDLPQPLLGRRNYNVGVYAQDDYKMTPKLMVNLGVRYEYESPMTIATDIYSRFDMATGKLLVAKQNASRSLNINTAKLDFAPRIGLAFEPISGTVIRAGFGTFYSQIMSNLGGQISFPGYDVPVSYTNLGSRVPQPFKLSEGMPITGVQDLKHPETAVNHATPSNPFSIGSVSYQNLSPMSMVQQWSAGLQQQFGPSTVLDLGYIATHGLHLPLFLNGNLPAFNQATSVAYQNTTLATQNARPFPTIGGLTGEFNYGQSNYNSLQVSVRSRLRDWLTIRSSYTWSHAIDDGSGIYNFSQAYGIVPGQYPSDPTLRRLDRSSSAFDVRHNFNLVAQYKTTGPFWLRNIEISPIFSAHSGMPISISQSNVFPGVTTQRPNGDTSKMKIHPYRNGSGIQYLKPVGASDFPLTPSGPVFTGTGAARIQVVATGLGNVPRYSLRAAGEINMDISAQRTFPIHDKVKFVFRVDAFNLFNHNNLSNPSTSLSVTTDSTHAFFNSPGFGLITAGSPERNLQIVTRLNF